MWQDEDWKHLGWEYWADGLQPKNIDWTLSLRASIYNVESLALEYQHPYTAVALVLLRVFFRKEPHNFFLFFLFHLLRWRACCSLLFEQVKMKEGRDRTCKLFHTYTSTLPPAAISATWQDSVLRLWDTEGQTSDQIRSDQSLSRVRLFATTWIAAHQASLSITNSLRLTSIESVMPSSHLILCRPLLLLPPIPPSIRVFSNESTLHMR